MFKIYFCCNIVQILLCVIYHLHIFTKFSNKSGKFYIFLQNFPIKVALLHCLNKFVFYTSFLSIINVQIQFYINSPLSKLHT